MLCTMVIGGGGGGGGRALLPTFCNLVILSKMGPDLKMTLRTQFSSFMLVADREQDTGSIIGSSP